MGIRNEMENATISQARLLNLSDAELSAIDTAIGELERLLSGLVALSATDERMSG